MVTSGGRSRLGGREGALDRVAQCGCISRCVAQAAWEQRSVPMTLGNARMTQACHDPGSGMGGSCACACASLGNGSSCQDLGYEELNGVYWRVKRNDSLLMYKVLLPIIYIGNSL